MKEYQNSHSENERNKEAGRLQKRWIDADENNLKMMEIQNWPAVARDQKQWRTILEAKVHLRL